MDRTITAGPSASAFVPKALPRVSAAGRNSRAAKREAWLRQVNPTDLFSLFDTMPGTQFFAKDRHGQVMFWCNAVRQVYQIEDETAVIGLTNFDVAPEEMAQVYAKGDARIYATGKPILNQVELCFDNLGIPNWFLVTKVPLHSREGRIIGIMGYSQPYEARANLLPPFHGVSKVVSHLRQNFQQAISVSEMARLAGLSERQLERKFKTHFGMGPRQFLIRTRLLAAWHLLSESDKSLSEIALACGFSTQSAFGQYFRIYLGLTPREFRRRNAA